MPVPVATALEWAKIVGVTPFPATGIRHSHARQIQRFHPEVMMPSRAMTAETELLNFKRTGRDEARFGRRSLSVVRHHCPLDSLLRIPDHTDTRASFLEIRKGMLTKF
jgi:hypothetical protein